MKDSQNLDSRLPTLLTKLSLFIFGLGILLVFISLILSVTSVRGFWVLSNVLIRVGVMLVMGGFSTSLCFASWVDLRTQSFGIRVFSILFNYLPVLLVLGGGFIYLMNTYWIDNANWALNGLRLHFAGYLALIFKFGWIRYLSTLSNALPPEKERTQKF